jgi:hypothetical protein
MCACAVGDSRLRVACASPDRAAAYGLGKARADRPAAKSSNSRTLCPSRPFTLELPFILKRVARAAGQRRSPQFAAIPRKSPGHPCNATGSILAMTHVKRRKGT